MPIMSLGGAHGDIISPVSCANTISTTLFCLNVDLDSVHVDDVAPPIINLSDAKRHASLLFTFLLSKSLYSSVDGMTSFQKLVGDLNKMTVANLGTQRHRSLDSYFKSYENICVFVWSYMFIYIA